MYLLSQDGRHLFNACNLNDIYVRDTAIIVESNKYVESVAEYSNVDEAMAVFNNLVNAVRRHKRIYRLDGERR